MQFLDVLVDRAVHPALSINSGKSRLWLWLWLSLNVFTAPVKWTRTRLPSGAVTRHEQRAECG